MPTGLLLYARCAALTCPLCSSIRTSPFLSLQSSPWLEVAEDASLMQWEEGVSAWAMLRRRYTPSGATHNQLAVGSEFMWHAFVDADPSNRGYKAGSVTVLRHKLS